MPNELTRAVGGQSMRNYVTGLVEEIKRCEKTGATVAAACIYSLRGLLRSFRTSTSNPSHRVPNIK
jgi:hypothetical protein